MKRGRRRRRRVRELKNIKRNRLERLRDVVAREAAMLLYTMQEREYKQAKERAARALGVRILPSNVDVAEWLDRISDECEGPSRRVRLVEMRREALRIMEALEDFNPKLVGSVWRGTANRNSDIDIVAFSEDINVVINRLRRLGVDVVRAEEVPVVKRGERRGAPHIYLKLKSGYEVEITVRSPEEVNREEICEIYGDPVRGLTCKELRRVLKENPLKRFTPKGL